MHVYAVEENVIDKECNWKIDKYLECFCALEKA